MATLVKKIGNQKRYEIDGFRAGGIIPYIFYNGKLLILVTNELQNKKIVTNSLGGKVDEDDTCIEKTIAREFNEETGKILDNLIGKIYNELIESRKSYKSFDRLNCEKAKYLSILYRIPLEDRETWINLPTKYNEQFNEPCYEEHRESYFLEWIDPFDTIKEYSFLLLMIIQKIQFIEKFKIFRKNDNKDLFIDE